MSLDFILIKSHGYPLCMDDIEVDSQFGAADYKNMADRFFLPCGLDRGDGNRNSR